MKDRQTTVISYDPLFIGSNIQKKLDHILILHILSNISNLINWCFIVVNLFLRISHHENIIGAPKTVWLILVERCNVKDVDCKNLNSDITQ